MKYRSAEGSRGFETRRPKPKSPAEIEYPSWALGKAFKTLCSMSSSSVGRTAYAHYSKGEWARLCSLEVNPRDYRKRSVLEFAVDYQIVSLFKKYEGFEGEVVDPKVKALGKFLESEERCRLTNVTFRNRWEGITHFPFHVEESFWLAKQKIRSILGRFDCDKFIESCRFGPGVDLGIHDETKTSSYFKYKTPGHATSGAIWVLENYFKDDRRLEYSHTARYVSSSALFYVPKKWDEYRTAAKEPRWNSFLQLGLGRCIEDNLREKVGLDIKHQADINRLLASSCHVDGTVTIDLRSASDSTSTNLLIDVLEGDEPDGNEGEGGSTWLDLILKLRTPYTDVKGHGSIRQEKVSSMGNGYTFPLEMLIFYGLAFGVCQHLKLDTSKIAVFGDDIIVPRDAAQLLIQLLGCCGYVPNIEKTFLRGEFFESCGHDYFRGRNVRPVFLKKECTNASIAYRLHNAFVEWGCRISAFSSSGGCHTYARDVCRQLISGIPKAHRLYGLRCESDGHLFAPWDVVKPTYHSTRAVRDELRDGWDGYSFWSWVVVPNDEYGGSYKGHLYSKLGGITDTGNNVTLRDAGRLVKKKIFVSSQLMADFVFSEM